MGNEQSTCVLQDGQDQEMDLEEVKKSIDNLLEKYQWCSSHKDYLERSLSLLNSIETRRIERTLVILDLNGVLIDRQYGKGLAPEEGISWKVGSFLVYVRPGLNDFLTWLFENYDVAVWSSVKKFNVDQLVKFIFDDEPYRFSKLKFVWHQDMTDQEENPDPALRNVKPLFIKDLRKVWDAFPEYDHTNTILVDDTKEKVRATGLPGNAKLGHILAPTWTHKNYNDKYLFRGGTLMMDIDKLVRELQD